MANVGQTEEKLGKIGKKFRENGKIRPERIHSISAELEDVRELRYNLLDFSITGSRKFVIEVRLSIFDSRKYIDMPGTKYFDVTSKPSDIRMVSGLYDHVGTWRLLLCRGNMVMLVPSSAEAPRPPYGNEVIFTLALPPSIAIEAGIGQDLLFLDTLHARQYTTLDARQYSRVTKYFELIRLSMETSDSAMNDNEIRYVTMALLKLCRQWFAGDGIIPDNSRQTEIANEFLHLVSKYCQTERSMSFYADKLAIANKYLSYIIKTRTGRTGADWIKEFTMTKAKELLLGTSLSVNEVSDRLNFIASSDFCKWFRRETGMSPKVFRNQLTGGRS